MSTRVKWFWFQIHYGPRSEVVALTGVTLSEVLDRLAAAQAGRLRYNPRGPRMTRIAALAEIRLDRAEKEFLDECLRLESGYA